MVNYDAEWHINMQFSEMSARSSPSLDYWNRFFSAHALFSTYPRYKNAVFNKGFFKMVI